LEIEFSSLAPSYFFVVLLEQAFVWLVAEDVPLSSLLSSGANLLGIESCGASLSH
jgi:hypothetical protein